MATLAGANLSKDFMTGAGITAGVLIVLLLFGFVLGRR